MAQQANCSNDIFGLAVRVGTTGPMYTGERLRHSPRPSYYRRGENKVSMASQRMIASGLCHARITLVRGHIHNS